MSTGRLLHRLRCLFRGQSYMRIRMNETFAGYTLRGTVIDIGGGHDPDYFSYFTIAPGAAITPIDGSMTGIDFEKDRLPYEDRSIDTVLLANVLEHIYAHQFLLTEIRRVMRHSGQLIGFVPFWIGYHPDPHDYFRYTREALARMFADAGFTDVHIVPVADGPLLANFNTIVLSVPRLIRPALYLYYAFLTAVLRAVRPMSWERTPLGYVFTAS